MKTATYTNIRNLFPFILAVCLGCLSTEVFAQTRIQTQISTGDDLRGGNTALISLVLVNGTGTVEVLPEQVLSTGLGGGSNNVISRVTFPRTVTATQIRSIRIRHDGSPRSGNPFDSYDNWDLKTLRVTLEATSTRPAVVLYNSAGDSRVGGLVARFTGDLRQFDLAIRPIGNEPDFKITGISGSPSGLGVRVANVGLGQGKVTNVTCSASNRAITSTVNIPVNQGATTSVHVNFAPVRGQRVTCSVSGVDSAGRPETVTANNNFLWTFF